VLFARDHVDGNQQLYRISTLVSSAIPPSHPYNFFRLLAISRSALLSVARDRSCVLLQSVLVTTQAISAGPGGKCTGRAAFRKRNFLTPDWPTPRQRHFSGLLQLLYSSPLLKSYTGVLLGRPPEKLCHPGVFRHCLFFLQDMISTRRAQTCRQRIKKNDTICTLP